MGIMGYIPYYGSCRISIINRSSQAAPVLFPMYTVAADVLLKMTRVEPHEKLQAGVSFKV